MPDTACVLTPSRPTGERGASPASASTAPPRTRGAGTRAGGFPDTDTTTDTGSVTDLGDRVAAAEGWQALALAAHGVPLTGAELAAAELLPADVALDLLFPDLDDAARQEALWALDDGAPPPPR
jgi:hypothetical protein